MALPYDYQADIVSLAVEDGLPVVVDKGHDLLQRFTPVIGSHYLVTVFSQPQFNCFEHHAFVFCNKYFHRL